MEIYDTIVLLIVLAGAFLVSRRLATQVASIVSIVASYMVAVNFARPWRKKLMPLRLGTRLPPCCCYTWVPL